MKYFPSLIVTVSVLSTSLSAIEYGRLLANHSDSVTIGEGDVFTALEWTDRHYFNSQENSGWPVTVSILQLSNMGDGETHNLRTSRNGTYGAINAPLVIVGPATIELTSIDWMMYKITRASEVEYKQANIVSLSADTVGAGTHEIVVEASDDLKSWTPVHSSSIGGNKTFFRTRVTEIGD